MPEIRVYDGQYNFIGPFAAYSRTTEYECIHCSKLHPIGTMCPTWLGELIEDQFLGNSSGERNGKG